MEYSVDEIIVGCRSRSQRHQTAMYNMFRIKMMALVRRYIDLPINAEEVLDDGFLRAFNKIDLYEGKGSFEGWLHRIMYHAVADAVKSHPEIASDTKSGWGRRGSRVEADERGMDGMLAKRGIYDTMVDKLGRQELDIMIERLPKATSKAFKMYISGVKHAEIGREMGITEGTSKWHISTARDVLKKLYK